MTANGDFGTLKFEEKQVRVCFKDESSMRYIEWNVCNRLNAYGYLSTAGLYLMIGGRNPSNIPDSLWGWTDSANVSTVHIPEEELPWQIVMDSPLPASEILDHIFKEKEKKLYEH